MFQNFILNAGVRPIAIHKSTIISRIVTQILRLLPTAPSIIPRYTSIGFCFVTATITSAATTSDNATAISRIAHAFPTLIWSLFTIRAKGSFLSSVKPVIISPSFSFVVVRASTIPATFPLFNTKILSQSSSRTSRSSPTQMTATPFFFWSFNRL